MKSAAFTLLLVAALSCLIGYSVVTFGWPPVGFEASGYVFLVCVGFAIASLIASAILFLALRWRGQVAK